MSKDEGFASQFGEMLNRMFRRQNADRMQEQDDIDLSEHGSEVSYRDFAGRDVVDLTLNAQREKHDWEQQWMRRQLEFNELAAQDIAGLCQQQAMIQAAFEHHVLRHWGP